MALCYTHNKHVSVLPLGEDRVRVTNHLDETYFSAEVEIEVTVPDLEIISSRGKVERSFNNECQDAVRRRLMEMVPGMRNRCMVYSEGSALMRRLSG